MSRFQQKITDGTVAQRQMMYEDDKSVSSFIGKLSLMLQDPTAQPYVSWSPSGESIVIMDPPRFSSQILPRYFKHSNFASFVRQLNLYGFHKSNQETDSCEFSHPVFRQGNEHVFKDIRRKVPSQSGSHEPAKTKSEMERMMQSIEELQARQAEFQSALKQKETEKMLIYQEMIQSKHRQDILEARMARMVGVLMQACHSIGLTQIEGENGNILHIKDYADGIDRYRLPKKQKLLENSASGDPGGSSSLEVAQAGDPTGGCPSWNSDAAGELLDALTAKLSSVAAGRGGVERQFRPVKFDAPTLVDVTDCSPSEALENPLDAFDPTAHHHHHDDPAAAAAAAAAAAQADPLSSLSSPHLSFGSLPSPLSQRGVSGLFLQQDVGESGQVSPMFARSPQRPAELERSASPQSLGGGTAVAACGAGDVDSVTLNSSLLLSPRGFEGYDPLTNDSLNSMEMGLDSQTLNLDNFLGADGTAAAATPSTVVKPANPRYQGR